MGRPPKILTPDVRNYLSTIGARGGAGADEESNKRKGVCALDYEGRVEQGRMAAEKRWGKRRKKAGAVATTMVKRKRGRPPKVKAAR